MTQSITCIYPLKYLCFPESNGYKYSKTEDVVMILSQSQSLHATWATHGGGGGGNHFMKLAIHFETTSPVY